MTYRDAQTHDNVVKVAPLYPLNSLMLHGIIYAKNASHLTAMSDADFADQAREFFGNGTQLQEMYITPKLLDKNNWDDLAEAARWSRQNADVLVDTHWIGGNPGAGEVYGWASWSQRKGILVLRNPTDQPADFAADFKIFRGIVRVFDHSFAEFMRLIGVPQAYLTCDRASFSTMTTIMSMTLVSVGPVMMCPPAF